MYHVPNNNLTENLQQCYCMYDVYLKQKRSSVKRRIKKTLQHLMKLLLKVEIFLYFTLSFKNPDFSNITQSKKFTLNQTEIIQN